MGYYIETPHNKGKAKWLHETYNTAVPTRLPKEFDTTGKTVQICVVDNGPFEAAAIAYSQSELNVFAMPDSIPRQWLIMNREDVIKECPRVKDALSGTYQEFAD